MNAFDDLLLARVRELLDGQFQGVLATQQQTRPYTSLMAFAATPDLRGLLIATLRQSRKHLNLLENSQVSFLIDNRDNSQADYQQAIAISASGRAHAVAKAHLAEMQTLFLTRHPGLQEFLALPECVLLRIEVEQYSVVSSFQEVAVLRMA